MKTCPKCRATYPKHFTVCPQDATPLQSLHELPAGAVIRGKYQILSKLGEGGMGVVYKARHVRFDEVVALKLVSAGLLEDPTFLQRFNAEAMVMRKLDHPHALRVHDIDETEDGNPFIVMEYVEGQPLSDLLRVGRPLDSARAIRIVMQTCEALGAAHKMGIIHRDIKPSNIMLARGTDSSEDVKVFDFGIAKVKEGSPLRGGASLTQTGMIVGTPAYMSPEQCKGVRGDKLDGRSDLYSLGIVLYEALTGRIPFSGESPTELLLAHLQQAPPDPRTLNASLPQPLVEIVLRTLAKDPAQRFADAEAMRDALAAVLDSPALFSDKTRVLGWQAPLPVGARHDVPVETETKSDTPVPHLTPEPTERVVTLPPKPSEPPQARQSRSQADEGGPPVGASAGKMADVPAGRPAPPTPVAPAAPKPAPPARAFGQGPASWSAPRRLTPRWIYAGAGSLAAIALLVFVLTRMPVTQPGSQPSQPAPAEMKSSGSAAPAEAPKEAVPQPKGESTASAPAEKPGEKPAVGLPKKIGATRESANPQEIRRLLAQGDKALDDGRYDEAIRVFYTVLTVDPSNQSARRGLEEAQKAKATEESVLRKKP